MERLGGPVGDGDVGSEVTVEGVLTLLVDGRPGQGRIDDRPVGVRWPGTAMIVRMRASASASSGRWCARTGVL